MTIKTPIIPQHQTFAKVHAPHELHFEAICVFAATGFFLEGDTYWKDQVVLQPAAVHTIDADGYLVDSKPYFKWHHRPREIAFETALEEFTTLFETIMREQTEGEQVILPLSGGLDSRSQAVALQQIGAEVTAYSYEYTNGYAETKIADKIAAVCNFDFETYTIPKGYLWKDLDHLATLNQCYSDFTTPRQMGVYKALKAKKGVFSLGHWGDVLFDDVGVSATMSLADQTQLVLSKIIKKGGREFAETLWDTWKLPGTFLKYLEARIYKLLSAIGITENANAQIRAFKSLYWAPRWTSINLSIFNDIQPIKLPYYDDRMCAFICSLPEAYLANRKLQMAYIKARAPKVAAVTWQDHRPFNLYNYHKNKVPYNIPYRVAQKLKRSMNDAIGRTYVQRNWELQFLGDDNAKQLKENLWHFNTAQHLPEPLVTNYLERFVNTPIPETAHPVAMLLTILKRLNLSETNN